MTENDATAFPHQEASTDDPLTPRYCIRIAGRFASGWSAWFDGMAITQEVDGTTTLTGALVDQAALHGLLQKVRDLGIPLLSVVPLTTDAFCEPAARNNNEEN